MHARNLQAAALLVGTASAAVLAYAGYASWLASRPPEIRVEAADLVLDGVSAGSAATVEFVVVNDGPDPARLLGVEAG